MKAAKVKVKVSTSSGGNRTNCCGGVGGKSGSC